MTIRLKLNKAYKIEEDKGGAAEEEGELAMNCFIWHLYYGYYMDHRLYGIKYYTTSIAQHTHLKTMYSTYEQLTAGFLDIGYLSSSYADTIMRKSSMYKYIQSIKEEYSYVN